MDYTAGLVFAKELAYDAGAMMRKYDSPTVDTDIKSDNSPVTVADKAINQLVIDRVSDVYPEHGVLGEEDSNYTDQPYVWVCDPIDGTVAYINHIPTSVFSIALVYEGLPVVAAIYNPWTDELYTALKGSGAFLNDLPIVVSGKLLYGSHIGASGSMSTHKSATDNVSLIDGLEGTAYVVNQVGGVFKDCLIASGYMEGRIFRGNGPHDVAASKLLIEEAGGKCTDLQGNQQRYDRPVNGAILSNGVIHKDLLKLV